MQATHLGLCARWSLLKLDMSRAVLTPSQFACQSSPANCSSAPYHKAYAFAKATPAMNAGRLHGIACFCALRRATRSARTVEQEWWFRYLVLFSMGRNTYIGANSAANARRAFCCRNQVGSNCEEIHFLHFML